MWIKEFTKHLEMYPFSHLCTPGQFQETGITVLIFSCLTMRPPLSNLLKQAFHLCHTVRTVLLKKNATRINYFWDPSTWVLVSHILVAMLNTGPATFALATSAVEIQEQWSRGKQHQHPKAFQINPKIKQSILKSCL